jgi:hypothetical protein
MQGRQSGAACRDAVPGPLGHNGVGPRTSAAGRAVMAGGRWIRSSVGRGGQRAVAGHPSFAVTLADLFHDGPAAAGDAVVDALAGDEPVEVVVFRLDRSGQGRRR